MRRCGRKQLDAPLASRNLLRPLPVRTEASLTASDGRSWRSRIRRGTDRGGQQTDGHDVFAKLPATARFLRIPAEDGSRREGSLRSATVDVAVPRERTILHA